jgi:hypothetical protein
MLLGCMHTVLQHISSSLLVGDATVVVVDIQVSPPHTVSCVHPSHIEACITSVQGVSADLLICSYASVLLTP